ncbi:MAG: hypothetical protein K2L83_05075 [Muribaculaceae bacterium]|nr:hypothetical protein [Muribaculaceae bacterium]
MAEKSRIKDPHNVASALRRLKLGERLVFTADRLSYVRVQASGINTVRGVKSLVVRPRPECGIIEVVREQ